MEKKISINRAIIKIKTDLGYFSCLTITVIKGNLKIELCSGSNLIENYAEQRHTQNARLSGVPAGS